MIVDRLRCETRSIFLQKCYFCYLLFHGSFAEWFCFCFVEKHKANCPRLRSSIFAKPTEGVV